VEAVEGVNARTNLNAGAAGMAIRSASETIYPGTGAGRRPNCFPAAAPFLLTSAANLRPRANKSLRKVTNQGAFTLANNVEIPASVRFVS
jgi:hypothetical protein